MTNETKNIPTYEYPCRSCGRIIEVFHSMLEAPRKLCPHCQALALERKIGTGAGLIFEGRGFYETDYKRSKAPTSSNKVSTPAKEAPSARPSTPKESSNS
jgi:putative FmdB family regulatory protein